DGKHFQVVPAARNSGLGVVVCARGAAFGDLFNDGRIDVVLNTIDGPPVLLRNVVNTGNNWVTLQLIGGAKGPRDAIGAKAFLTAGGITQRNDVISGGSYISNNDMRLHFGIGKEIGRASCRERVEMWGVAVVVKESREGNVDSR